MYLSKPFKDEFRLCDRYNEAVMTLLQFPDKVPIICERPLSAPPDCPIISKRKYVVPRHFTMGQFLFCIRKQLNLPPEKALFLFVHNKLISSTELIHNVYERYKDNEDCFLYMFYSLENTFG